MPDSEQGYRRSDHAEYRSHQRRPIDIAYADAQRATRSDIFLQLDGRFVVRGAKGREHIFEPSGELVTSFVRSQSAHLGKTQTGERWSVTMEQYYHFKELFL